MSVSSVERRSRRLPSRTMPSTAPSQERSVAPPVATIVDGCVCARTDPSEMAIPTPIETTKPPKRILRTRTWSPVEESAGPGYAHPAVAINYAVEGYHRPVDWFEELATFR